MFNSQLLTDLIKYHNLIGQTVSAHRQFYELHVLPLFHCYSVVKWNEILELSVFKWWMKFWSCLSVPTCCFICIKNNIYFYIITFVNLIWVIYYVWYPTNFRTISKHSTRSFFLERIFGIGNDWDRACVATVIMEMFLVSCGTCGS